MAKTQINPKNLVKVGRLKQVADSLSSSADYKRSALKQMVPTFGYDDEKVKELLSSQSSDSKSAAKYNKIILGAKDKAAKK